MLTYDPFLGPKWIKLGEQVTRIFGYGIID